jgi:hypothetical protein
VFRFIGQVGASVLQLGDLRLRIRAD